MRLPHFHRDLSMSASSIALPFSQVRKTCRTISFPVTLVLTTSVLASEARPQETSLAVKDEVATEPSLSLPELQAMPPFLIRNVPVLRNRVRDRIEVRSTNQ